MPEWFGYLLSLCASSTESNLQFAFTITKLVLHNPSISLGAMDGYRAAGENDFVVGAQVSYYAETTNKLVATSVEGPAAGGDENHIRLTQKSHALKSNVYVQEVTAEVHEAGTQFVKQFLAWLDALQEWQVLSFIRT